MTQITHYKNEGNTLQKNQSTKDIHTAKGTETHCNDTNNTLQKQREFATKDTMNKLQMSEVTHCKKTTGNTLL